MKREKVFVWLTMIALLVALTGFLGLPFFVILGHPLILLGLALFASIIAGGTLIVFVGIPTVRDIVSSLRKKYS